MKWLFATLVGLNLIVFAGMIASKMLKQHMPVTNQPTVNPPSIIINGYDLVAKNSASAPASASAASGAATSAVAAGSKAAGSKTTTNKDNKDSKETTKTTKSDNKDKPREGNRNADNNRGGNNDSSYANNGTSRAKYKECSARVSMPEDDYHRIKGLLARYPHAASRQVVDNGNGESAARMNVVFMQVSDQEASAIQGVVGRYGQLNRSACNR